MLVQHPLPEFTYSDNTGIKINVNETYQNIDGFGWALTGGSAQVIQGLPQDVKIKLLY